MVTNQSGERETSQEIVERQLRGLADAQRAEIDRLRQEVRNLVTATIERDEQIRGLKSNIATLNGCVERLQSVAASAGTVTYAVADGGIARAWINRAIQAEGKLKAAAHDREEAISNYRRLKATGTSASDARQIARLSRRLNALAPLLVACRAFKAHMADFPNLAKLAPDCDVVAAFDKAVSRTAVETTSIHASDDPSWFERALNRIGDLQAVKERLAKMTQMADGFRSDAAELRLEVARLREGEGAVVGAVFDLRFRVGVKDGKPVFLIERTNQDG